MTTFFCCHPQAGSELPVTGDQRTRRINVRNTTVISQFKLLALKTHVAKYIVKDHLPDNSVCWEAATTEAHHTLLTRKSPQRCTWFIPDMILAHSACVLA